MEHLLILLVTCVNEDEEFEHKANIPRSRVSLQDVANGMCCECWVKKLWIRIVSVYTLKAWFKLNDSK